MKVKGEQGDENAMFGAWVVFFLVVLVVERETHGRFRPRTWCVATCLVKPTKQQTVACLRTPLFSSLLLSAVCFGLLPVTFVDLSWTAPPFVLGVSIVAFSLVVLGWVIGGLGDVLCG